MDAKSQVRPIVDGLDRHLIGQLRCYMQVGHGRHDSLARDALGAMTGYGYDPISRLSSLSHDLDGAGSTNDATFGFAYNPASQIVSRSLSNNAYEYPVTSSTRSYAVNGRNQYTQVGGVSHTWDANGNLTSDGATTFGYDTENRLVSASGAKNASLAYDPLGRLYQVTSGANTTRFVYDGDRLVAEYNGSGTLQRRYVHGPGVDEPLVWYEGSSVSSANRRYLHANHQGSIVATSNAAGVKLANPRLRPLRRHRGQQYRAVPVHRPGGDPRAGTSVLQGQVLQSGAGAVHADRPDRV